MYRYKHSYPCSLVSDAWHLIAAATAQEANAWAARLANKSRSCSSLATIILRGVITLSSVETFTLSFSSVCCNSHSSHTGRVDERLTCHFIFRLTHRHQNIFRSCCITFSSPHHTVATMHVFLTVTLLALAQSTLAQLNASTMCVPAPSHSPSLSP